MADDTNLSNVKLNQEIKDRKNWTHLWSKQEHDINSHKNIELSDVVKNKVNKDSIFHVQLEEMKNFLASKIKFSFNEDELCEVIPKVQSFVMLELILYLSMKAMKTDNFYLDDIKVILSSNPDFYKDSWDREVAYKFNILFKRDFSFAFLEEMIGLYTEFINEKDRLFEFKESSIEKIADLELETRILSLRKSISKLEDKKISLEKVLEENCATDVKSLKKIKDELAKEQKILIRQTNKLKREKERLENTLRTKDYTFVSLNEDCSQFSYRSTLFENILKSNHPYEYSVIFRPFPNKNDEGLTVAFKNKDTDKDSYNIRNSVKKKLKCFYTGKTLEATHKFEITDYIEKRKQEKRKRNLNSFKFNLLETAKKLDSNLIANRLENYVPGHWINLAKSVSFKEIYERSSNLCINDYLSKDITINEATHLVGMLGAGKSIFSLLLTYAAINEGLIVSFITKDKTASIEIYKKLAGIGITDTTIFKGNDNEELVKKEYNELFSELSKGDISFSKIYNENAELMKILESNSIIETKYNEFFEGEYKGLELIPLRTKKGVVKYANPEYIENGLYYGLQKIKQSKVIIGNIHAYMQTNLPYQLDIYRRDFLTVINTISDIVIIDEIDEIQAISDSIYYRNNGLASDLSGQYYDNIYKILPDCKRSKHDDNFTKQYLSTVSRQQFLLNDILSLCQQDRGWTKSQKLLFTMNEKLKSFIVKYYDIDENRVNYGLIRDLSKLLSGRALGFELSIIEESQIKRIASSLLDLITLGMGDVSKMKEAFSGRKRKTDADIISKKYNLHIPKDSIKDMTLNAYIIHFVHLFAEKHSLELSDKCIVKIQKNSSELNEETYENRINNELIYDFKFIALMSLFEDGQWEIDSNTSKYLTLMGKNYDDLESNVTKTKNLPTNHTPLISKRYLYEISRTNSKDIDYKIGIRKYISIGREILFNISDVVSNVEKINKPLTVVMSASSYMPHSTKYHVNIKPTHIIQNLNQKETKITANLHLTTYNNEVITISGSKENEKYSKIIKMMRSIIDDGLIDNVLKKVKKKKQIIGIPVPSFAMAEVIGSFFHNNSKYKVVSQYDDNKTCINGKIVTFDETRHIRRDNVHELYEHEGVDIFVFVMASIGRGFNILQDINSYESLIGAMFFPVRPFLHPDDVMFAINSLHNKMISMIKDAEKFVNCSYTKQPQFLVYAKVIGKAISLYNRISSSGKTWNSMCSDDKMWMVANFLVEIMQTIGRGLRGGTDLDIYLLDGSFVSEKTRKSYLENNCLSYEKLESKNDSFLSMCEYILSGGDEVFKAINHPIINAFKGIILKEETCITEENEESLNQTNKEFICEVEYLEYDLDEENYYEDVEYDD